MSERLQRRFDDSRKAHIISGTVEDIRALLETMWSIAEPHGLQEERDDLIRRALTSEQPFQWNPYRNYRVYIERTNTGAEISAQPNPVGKQLLHETFTLHLVEPAYQKTLETLSGSDSTASP